MILSKLSNRSKITEIKYACNDEIHNTRKLFGTVISQKFKRNIILEVIINDTIKPIGRNTLEHFRTLMTRLLGGKSIK